MRSPCRVRTYDNINYCAALEREEGPFGACIAKMVGAIARLFIYFIYLLIYSFVKLFTNQINIFAIIGQLLDMSYATYLVTMYDDD